MLHQSKFPFVSRIEFIRSKLSNLSAHVSGVVSCTARRGIGARLRWPIRYTDGWRSGCGGVGSSDAMTTEVGPLDGGSGGGRLVKLLRKPGTRVG